MILIIINIYVQYIYTLSFFYWRERVQASELKSAFRSVVESKEKGRNENARTQDEP